MTLLSALWRLPARVRRWLRDPDRFLRRLRGVVHVGANRGQERDLYRRRGLRVVWVEPIPEVFAELQENLRGFPEQRALQALVTDRDGVPQTLHVSSNRGNSSSLLDLALHADIWPSVHYDHDITLRSVTLPTLLYAAGVDLRGYDGLVVDAQASELLILRGAVPLLRAFRFIKLEAADFEVYRDCPKVEDISAFLAAHGFREWVRHRIAWHPAGGSCFNIVYERVGVW
jgi:FkbM family methyltransferase